MVPLEVRSPFLAEAIVGALQCASMVTQAHSFPVKVWEAILENGFIVCPGLQEERGMN